MDRPTFLTFLSSFPVGLPWGCFWADGNRGQQSCCAGDCRGCCPGGFKLKPTHAEMPPVYSAFTAATVFDEGMRHCSDPDLLEYPNANLGRYKITPEAPRDCRPVKWNIAAIIATHLI